MGAYFGVGVYFGKYGIWDTTFVKKKEFQVSVTFNLKMVACIYVKVLHMCECCRNSSRMTLPNGAGGPSSHDSPNLTSNTNSTSNNNNGNSIASAGRSASISEHSGRVAFRRPSFGRAASLRDGPRSRTISIDETVAAMSNLAAYEVNYPQQCLDPSKNKHQRSFMKTNSPNDEFFSQFHSTLKN